MQDNWQWCTKCSGLAYLGLQVLGPCPDGGQHNHDGSGNYALAIAGESSDGQNLWKWCANCQGLYFVGNGSHGYCPASGPHVDSGIYDYRLPQAGDGQPNWQFCEYCQGLWFAGQVADSGSQWLGKCPAPGRDGHSLVGSGGYVLNVSNGPAGPPAPGTVTVTGLTNTPPGPFNIGEKQLQIRWPAYPETGNGAVFELYESSGPGAERFIAELPISDTSNVQNMYGDFRYGLVHCFSLRVRNSYGWSGPSRGCGATLEPGEAETIDVSVDLGGDGSHTDHSGDTDTSAPTGDG